MMTARETLHSQCFGKQSCHLVTFLARMIVDTPGDERLEWKWNEKNFHDFLMTGLMLTEMFLIHEMKCSHLYETDNYCQRDSRK